MLQLTPGFLTLAMVAVAAPQPPQWTVDSAPAVSIGGGDGPADLLRVVGALRLPDGRIVVANHGTHDVRLYSATGRIEASFGRKGSGPGEFENIGWLGRVVDTILVYDGSHRRITRIRFGAKSPLVGITRVVSTSDRPFSIAGRLSSGEWLATTGISPTFEGPPGVRRLPGSVGVVPPDGAGAVRWVATMPSGAVFVHSPTGRLEGASVGLIAFSPFLVAEAQDNILWIGDTAADTLLRYSGGRGPPAVIRLDLPRRPMTKAIAERSLAAQLAETRPAGHAFARAAHSAPNLPAALPTFGSLTAPSGGTELWVSEHRVVPADSIIFHVLGPDGRRIGQVVAPARFSLTDAGPDWILGIARDSDDVEYVRMFRLTRSPPTPR